MQGLDEGDRLVKRVTKAVDLLGDFLGVRLLGFGYKRAAQCALRLGAGGRCFVVNGISFR